MRSRQLVEVYRGWAVLHTSQHVDGRRSFYSVRPSRELRRTLIRPPHVASPEFGSVDEARAWIDETAPFMLP